MQTDEQLLSQIGGHAVQPIDIGFAAAGGGVGAGVAVEADKVLGAPAIGGVDPGGQTGGVAGSQLLGGGIAGEANVEIGVRPQEIGQTDADIVGDILFRRPLASAPALGLVGLCPWSIKILIIWYSLSFPCSVRR